MRTRALPLLGILVALLLSSCSGGVGSGELTSESQPGSAAPVISKLEFFQAVATGTPNEVASLLSRGAEIDANLATDSNRLTPLMVSIVLDRAEVATLLVANGASLSASFHGYTARDFAFLLRRESVLQFLARRNQAPGSARR